ncbi:MAG: sulfur-carrier protein [Chloroflexota bacterium]|nr:sulfur-carrier protein [Chloroflexota bacterium]
MATVWIPSQLRDLTGGAATVEAAGATMRELIDGLDASYPGMKARLCESDRLRPALQVAVDGVVTRLGMREPLEPHSEVSFIPAVGGG